MHEQLNSVGCVPFQSAEMRKATKACDVWWQLCFVWKAQIDRMIITFRYMQIARGDTLRLSVSSESLCLSYLFHSAPPPHPLTSVLVIQSNRYTPHLNLQLLGALATLENY